MSRILLVTQPSRSVGEFRRPWVRRLYRRYAARYRDNLVRAVTRLAGHGDLTVLAARELVDADRMPAGVTLCYYDEGSFRVDSEELAKLTRRLATGWWPKPASAPALAHRGIWLPEVMAMSRGMVLRAEVAEPLGAVDGAFASAKPERVELLTGASLSERLARLLAEREGLPVTVAAPGFLGARLYALVIGWLFPREERLRARDFVQQPRRASPVAQAAARPRFLLVTCRPRHHFVMDPLADALRAAGAETWTLATPTLEPEYRARIDALKRSGAGYLTDFLSAAEARKLLQRHRRALAAAWRGIEAGPAFADTLRWKGIDLTRVSRPFLQRSMRPGLLAALLYSEAACRALDALRPDAIVVTSNRRHAERALALAARERGIPCLLFSGTLIMGRDRSRLFDIGDRMLVIGEYLKERLVTEQGVAASLISVVGDPRSDAARLVPPAELRLEVFADFRLAPGKPLLVFLSKYVSLLFSIQEKEAFYRTMTGARTALGHPHVVIKVHPNEDLPLLREQARQWGWPDAILTKEYDIHRLLAAADAAVMVTSMAGLEAMALDCPVVALQATGKDYEGEYMPPYVSEGVVERVDMGDTAALVAVVRRLLSDPDHRQALIERGRGFAARYVHPVDGALGERVLAVVDEVRRELAEKRAR